VTSGEYEKAMMADWKPRPMTDAEIRAEPARRRRVEKTPMNEASGGLNVVGDLRRVPIVFVFDRRAFGYSTVFADDAIAEIRRITEPECRFDAAATCYADSFRQILTYQLSGRHVTKIDGEWRCVS
jgi:hypothetical protein